MKHLVDNENKMGHNERKDSSLRSTIFLNYLLDGAHRRPYGSFGCPPGEDPVDMFSHKCRI